MAPEYDLVYTENPKVCGVEDIASIVATAKEQRKTVGLITGCLIFCIKATLTSFVRQNNESTF